VRAFCKLACSVLMLCGCNVSLPDEYFVADLRVLDLKVRPPEISLFAKSDDPLSLDPSDPPMLERTEVEVTALVAHPDLDASFSYDWIRCRPGLDPVPCDDETERLGADEPTLRVIPADELFEDVAGGASIGSIGLTLAEDPRDLLNGLYAYLNLSARVAQAAIEVDTPRLEATKRVVVFEPRLVAAALREAQRQEPGAMPMVSGVDLPTLCTQLEEPELQELYAFLESRSPNAPPSYPGVEIEIEDANGVLTATVGVRSGDAIEVEPGGRARMKATLVEEEAESYRLIDANCVLQDFEERLGVSWFTQLGELTRQLTTEDDPETSWLAPLSVDEEGARARIWSVVRDGRGGSEHLRFDIVVRSRR
jgi:hypothetical protein